MARVAGPAAWGSPCPCRPWPSLSLSHQSAHWGQAWVLRPLQLASIAFCHGAGKSIPGDGPHSGFQCVGVRQAKSSHSPWIFTGERRPVRLRRVIASPRGPGAVSLSSGDLRFSRNGAPTAQVQNQTRHRVSDVQASVVGLKNGRRHDGSPNTHEGEGHDSCLGHS